MHFVTKPYENEFSYYRTILYWPAKSRITVHFSQFFSGVSWKLKHFKPRSWWTKWSTRRQLVLLGVLNDEFVAGLTGFVPRSHFVSSCAICLYRLPRQNENKWMDLTQSLPLLCFGRCNFKIIMFHKVVWRRIYVVTSFMAVFPRSVPVNEFWKSVNI